MLDIGTFMCHLIIRVNDVEVFSLNIDGQMSTEIPINMGILSSGIQDIEVIGYPLKGEMHLHKDSYIRYKPILYDVENNQFRLLETLDNRNTAPVKDHDKFLIHKSTFEAKVPYVLEAFQNGVNLKNANLDIKEKLISEFSKIVKLINTNDLQNFVKSYSKKEINNAKSMFLGAGESKDRMQKILDDITSGFKAAPISNDVHVEYMGYGKLATLKRTDGLSALYLENDETNEELILQINYFMPEGGEELEII